MSFGPVSAERTHKPAAWLKNADWLPDASAPVEMRYRDSTRMGKIYLMPDGVSRPVAGWDEQGPDADDPELTLDVWRARIAKHNGELKNLLRNQSFVAGIGNAYSDEILWEAKLAPFRTRASLAPAEVDALYAATRKVLPWAIEQLRTGSAASRGRAAQVPERPLERFRGVPALWHALDRGQGRRVRDNLVPRLPTLATVRGQRRLPRSPGPRRGVRLRARDRGSRSEP